MNEYEQKLHRTWTHLLLDYGYKEAAAVALDIDIGILYDDDWNRNALPEGLVLHIPTSSFNLVNSDDELKELLTRAILRVTRGHIFGESENPEIEYRVKIMDVEEDWKSVIRELIVQLHDPNQGLVTELASAKQGRKIYSYNGMKFASQSEIRIAQELENRKVLFFPLPLAVRADTGNEYRDHREVDFLICNEGIWGILEVSYHPDRFEKDAEKDNWFKESGILCIQHYTAERCYKNPSEIVENFLKILAKHKR